MKKTVILFLSLFYSVYLATGQIPNLNFQHYNNEDGLSQLTVKEIFQDSKGFMWFSTTDGLNRFDGYEFEVYRYHRLDSSSISSNHVSSIVEDDSGFLWFGTWENGLNRFNPVTENFKHYLPNKNNERSIPGKNINSIFIDSRAGMWISSGKRLCRYNPESDDFTVYPFSIDDCEFAESPDGNLWLGSYRDGLFRFNPETEKIELIAKADNQKDRDSLNLFAIRGMVMVNDTLWVACLYGGLEAFDIKTGEYENYSFPGKIKNMCPDRYSSLWIATTKGLIEFELQSKQWRRYTADSDDSRSLSENLLETVYTGKDDMLWVGYFNSGLSKCYYKNNIHHYKHLRDNPKTISGNNVLCLYRDSENNFWIGYLHNGLDKISPDGIIHNYRFSETEEHSIASDLIFTIFEDNESNLWISTSKGLCKYIAAEDHFRRYEIYPARKIVQDKKGNLWMAGHNAVMKFNPQTGEKFEYKSKKSPLDFPFGSFFDIARISDSVYWFGHSQGILELNTETLENSFIQHNDSIAGSISAGGVSTIIVARDSTLWLGTENGINKYIAESGKFIAYTEEDGLSNNMIYSMLDDEHANLWISTNKGINCFNPYTGNIRIFRQKDGLQSDEFFNVSAYRDENGFLYFGGVNGYNAFYPDSLKPNSFIPQIQFTDFLLQNNPVIVSDSTVLSSHINHTKEIILGYNDYPFAFEFTALNYRRPEKNRYKYKLEGFDRTWIETDAKNRRASYGKIPAGKYTFRLLASNNDGVWNKEGKSIVVIIRPPWWKTWWAMAVWIMLTVGSLLAFYFVRVNALKKRAGILERKVQARTAEVVKQKNEIETKNEELNQTNEELNATLEVVNNQKQKIEEAHKNITDSINYASRIQSAVLPTKQVIRYILPEHFILFKPRDIVSGDFYWIQKVNQHILVAAADCTGHGVPGAFMSMLGVSFLNEIVRKEHIVTANQVLDSLRYQVKTTLDQTGKSCEAKDGMDIAFCVIDTKTNRLQFAGAHNPLYIIRHKDKKAVKDEQGIKTRIKTIEKNDFVLTQISANSQPIGVFVKEKPFSNNEIQLLPGDKLYMFSDGYADQLGGIANRKFLTQSLKKLLLDIHTKPMKEQHDLLDQTIEDWKAGREQLDDILVMGIKM